MHERIYMAAAMALGALAAVGGCTDPVHDGAVHSLGAEKSNIPTGEFHRAGQPCTVCHQESGPADTVFVVGGTIFDTPDTLVGVPNVQVQLIDSSTNKAFLATTNCVGNFFVKDSDWSPQFPILVHIVSNNSTIEMTSPIGRDGSCANCHISTVTPTNPQTQVGHIYTGSPADPTAPCGYPANLGAQ